MRPKLRILGVFIGLGLILAVRAAHAVDCLLISEFMASNGSSIVDEDGDSSDWIEIESQCSDPIDIEGYYLTGNAGNLAGWSFPSTVIEPGGRLLVFASDKNRRIAGEELHTDFQLDASGEYLALVEPDGVTIVHEYAPEYPRQLPDVSYGTGQGEDVVAIVRARVPARTLIPQDGSLGLSWTGGDEPFDDSGWIDGDMAVGYSRSQPGFAVRTIFTGSVNNLATAEDIAANPNAHGQVFIENTAMINYFNTGGPGHHGNDRPYPGTTINEDANRFVVEARGFVTIPSAGPWTFGVNSDDGFGLDLRGSDGQSFHIEHPTDRGPGDTTGVFNVTSPGDFELTLIHWENGGGASVEIFARQGNHGGWNSGFRLIGDTESGGLAVSSDPEVFGNGGAGGTFLGSLLGTDVEESLYDSGTCAYVRIPFEVADPVVYQSLTLRMKYDDGFIAYLNGVEIASRNAPANASYNSTATAERAGSEILSSHDIDVSDRLDRLVAGTNVLALHGLNFSPDSDDFLIAAELAEITLLEMETGYYLEPTPGLPNAEAFSEIVADPEFDTPRGFYDDPFEVTLTTTTPDATIVFTTNGSRPTLENGTTYEGPLLIDGLTTLQAIAFKEGLAPSYVVTHTYIFLDDVLRQPTNPPGFPSSWNGTAADYQVDPDVVNDPAYSGMIRDAMMSVPTMSIVMNTDDFFGARGVYSNPHSRGVSWERFASMEVILPEGVRIAGDGDSSGVQVGCGIRMYGGVGRNPEYRKHSLRLLFKGRYGATKLRYPLFGNAVPLNGRGPTEEFDTLILRARFNASWHVGDGSATYMRDQHPRDILLRMGRPQCHGTYMHLYINGLYWGLYNVVERASGPFNASYRGGQREDYDSLNSGKVLEGDKSHWDTAQGITVGPDDFDRLGQYVDVPNLIDYMMVNFFIGNRDWDGHNWYAGRKRSPDGKWFFYSWDAEHTYGSPTGDNRTGISNGGNPSGFYSRLRNSADFRLLFGDQAHGHLFNGGELTPAKLAESYTRRRDEIRDAVVGESARWGDTRSGSPLTRDVHWTNETNRMLNSYFPARPAVLLGFLRGAGLYPSPDAPIFARHGGQVERGFSLTMNTTAGVMYFTLDGSDPRLPDGDISPSAEIAEGSGLASLALVQAGADARVLVPQNGDLGLSWTAPDFDDSSWTPGQTGVGYDNNSDYDNLIETDVGTEMSGVNATVYIRLPFEVDDPARLSFLQLRMKYDDGFIAYLNGERVADRLGVADPQWNSTASGNHSDSAAVVFESIDVPGGLDLLQPGTNVLAIHGLNTGTGSSDMLIVPELRATEVGEDEGTGITIDRTTLVRARTLDGGEWSALNEATFVPDDQDFRVTELMYNPPAIDLGGFETQDFEFIELQNLTQRPLRLQGIEFADGVRFEFSGSMVEELGPREIVLVVKSLAAFESRYDTDGLLIAGEYSGNLDNGGERVVLLDAAGEVMQEFEYSDEWYPATDGVGFSLVVRNPEQPLERWNEPAGWHDSRVDFGTPGESTASSQPLQLAGDANQDGILDLSDAVRLLLVLFRPERELPCDGDLSTDGNRTLLDFNGDDSVDVSDAVAKLAFLYQDGPPPALGTRCRLIDGCTQVVRCASLQ